MTEFAAVLTIGLPLLTLMVFVTLECTRFFTIKSAMEHGARTAARLLVTQYNTTQQENTNSSLSGLMMKPFIASTNQFHVTWDTATPPTFVTVACDYPTDGSYGLEKFPAGPLRYISNNSTFNLGNIKVTGTFTVPVQ
jgi:Flp pilus assembly protein TadG